MKIKNRLIGDEQPPYIIAEISANHAGKIQLALDSISAAADCGVDAVKIQSYSADTITINCRNPEFMISSGLWQGKSLYELYQWAQTPFEWHQELFEYAEKLGITLFSSPFDDTAIDLLETLSTPAYKIASFELIDIPLIKYAKQTGKPMILSTGMASLEEIQDAADVVKDNYALLHCTSAYPAPASAANLQTMVDLKQRFNVPVGLSDHTLGNEVALASVALGANIIEKHFILDKSQNSPDASFSIEPKELTQLCNQSRLVWQALGEVSYGVKLAEKQSLKHRRSLYAVKDIKASEILTKENVRSIRPAQGLEPKYLPEVLGKKAKADINYGTALDWNLLEGE